MTDMEDADLLADVLGWLPLLDTVDEDSFGQELVERRLDVSRATGYRITERLREAGLIEESNGGYALTKQGERTAESAASFRDAVSQSLESTERDRAVLVDLVGLAPALDAFEGAPLDRRELERRLGVSKTTGYRFTRGLQELELLTKTGGRYERTAAGDAVAEALGSFASTVWMARLLAPALEAIPDTVPPIPVEAFTDATVTRAAGGDAYGQLARFIELVEETGSLRGIDFDLIVPMYIHEMRQPILDGLAVETIDAPEIVEDTADKYPYECVNLCVNGSVDLWVHDDLPFGLAIFDNRVGIGVQDPVERRLGVFVDTDASAVREWAEAVFETYRSESVRLDRFTKQGLREALARRDSGY